MKICILSEYFYPDSTGGSGTVLSKMVRHLQDQYEDLEIDVITSKNLFRGEAGSLPAQEDWDGVNISRLRAPQPSKNSIRRRLTANLKFTNAVLLKLLARQKKYDLVLVVTAPPTLAHAARAYSLLTNTPYIYLIYDLYLDLAMAMNMIPRESRLVNRLKGVQKKWLHSSAKTVVLGRCMRDHIMRQYEMPAEQINVVPIPIDPDLVTPMGKDTRFRADNALNGFVVLYAGNFARYQDFDTLLDAAKLLKDKQDITFAFVGNGVKADDIRERIEQEQITNVKMLPFVPEEDLSDMLASADVSLVTLESGAEGLAVPSKFYNIMASGRPTVAIVSPVSEVAQVMEEAECGVRVDPGNAAMLAEALADLATTPDRLERMGRNARRVCEERYSVRHIGQQFYNTFTEVIHSRQKVARHPRVAEREAGEPARTRFFQRRKPLEV